MKKLIFDTDIDTDCDDSGAMAVLHNLAGAGEVEPLGVICSIPKRSCALCVSAMNYWYGREDLPVGLVRVPDWTTSPRFAAYQGMLKHIADRGTPLYNEIIGADHERAHPGLEFPDAVRVYRRLLTDADDRSVTICAVGTLTALEQLLHSEPDDVSPLSGRDLIAAKVLRLVTMALGHYPSGADTFNWRMDTIGAAAVVNEWPVPITVSEHGETVRVGPRFIAACPPDHPVRRAYEIWLGAYGDVAEGRSSWDQVALVRAIRGCGDLYQEHGGLGLRMDPESGEHEWLHEQANPERSWIEPRVTDAELAYEIESLMIGEL